MSARAERVAGLLAILLFIVSMATAAASEESCRPADWKPPKDAQTVTVRNTDDLIAAVRRAEPGTVILVEDGEYRLWSSLDFAKPDVVLAGKSGHRDRVVIRGDGMTEKAIGVALSISASRVTIADLTVGNVGYHGIQIRGENGVAHVVVHNVHIVDTGQQLLKGSLSANGLHAEDCVVACSLFEYTRHAPSDYTNGVDVLGGRRWIVRDNRFLRIRGPAEGGWEAGPAILFWRESADTVVERNVVEDSYRGIALGLVEPVREGRTATYDHTGGTIRDNVVVNRNSWADEGIEVNAARDVSIERNRLLKHGLPWSISVRFPVTTATVVDNRANQPLALRDGARATERGNLWTTTGDDLDPSGFNQ